jgi:hypothetical protein
MKYWTSQEYYPFLAHSPNFFACDDHEFWNNFPDTSFWLARSTDPEERPKYAGAALCLYDLFQAAANPGRQRWFSFKIEPVSFFVADTRSRRDSYGPRAGVMEQSQVRQLRQWVSGLRGPGILVLGQPLFDNPGGGTDRTLPDYPQHYALLWDLIEQAGHQILVLSGDIHIGRYAMVPERPGVPNRPRISEFIASPTSLVPTSPIGGPIQFRGRVKAPSRVHPKGIVSSESRDVELKWGTNADTFGLVELKRIETDRPQVRVTLQLWDVEEQRTAISELDGGICCEELILE